MAPAGHRRGRAAHGGLHRSMGWQHPILTDAGVLPGVSASGALRKVAEEGVTFGSPVNGDWLVPDARDVYGDPARALDSDVDGVLTSARPGRSGATRPRSRWSFL
ncbi:MAG: hypothetical protein IPG84_18285 [Betaproteobacteria bacterium]|nr:hypothetical protein [Betaproteobacteria bacterium]